MQAALWRRLGGPPADARALIAAFPGPAMLLAADGEVIAANGDAGRLAGALARGRAQEVRALATGIAASGRPGAGQTMLNAETESEGVALYTLTGIAVAGRQVIMLARDASAEYAMRQALIASRELYRDLARCSSDFSWQTDASGVFSFVSAKGALGFSASALNGRSSLGLMADAGADDAPPPFAARQPVENAEITLRDAGGETRICLVHAVPVFDGENNWRGARGVCTDVTEARQRQRALDAMRARDEQIRKLIEATQHGTGHERGFAVAASIIASAMAAEHCALVAIEPDGGARLLGDATGPATPPEPLLRALRQLGDDPGAASEHEIDFEDDAFIHQAVSVAHGGRVNGAIWLRWKKPGSPAQADGLPRTLAQSAASHIGIAIAHANQWRILNELSRTDGLTGLLNRRAFTQDLAQRHAHRYRVRRPAALLYIDVDNFKPVNDRFGHALGDNVLRELAALLRSESRAGDLGARLGGDEFGLWLEDTDAAGAAIKAQHLLDALPHLRSAVGLPSDAALEPVGFSIGVAIVDPQIPETLDQTMSRADAAMYQVKHEGKGGLCVAPIASSANPATEPAPC